MGTNPTQLNLRGVTVTCVGNTFNSRSEVLVTLGVTAASNFAIVGLGRFEIGGVTRIKTGSASIAINIQRQSVNRSSAFPRSIQTAAPHRIARAAERTIVPAANAKNRRLVVSHSIHVI
jgi:hypothetical protein